MSLDTTAAGVVPAPLLHPTAQRWLEDIAHALLVAAHQRDQTRLEARGIRLRRAPGVYAPAPFDPDDADRAPSSWLAHHTQQQADSSAAAAAEVHMLLAADYLRATVHALRELRGRRAVTARNLESAGDIPVLVGQAAGDVWRAELRPDLPAIEDIDVFPATLWSRRVREVHRQLAEAYADAARWESTACSAGDADAEDIDELGEHRGLKLEDLRKSAARIPELLVELAGTLHEMATQRSFEILRYDRRFADRAAGRCVPCDVCGGCETGPLHSCAPCDCHVDPHDSAGI
ncbi:hypothetical protein [Amycolatopsis sp. NPDC058986]|uniref:hypothetical protein n=1 Tax=unclassified Amycolatopsis TaxID=2618356 RepID=UPI00366B1DBF